MFSRLFPWLRQTAARDVASYSASRANERYSTSEVRVTISLQVLLLVVKWVAWGAPLEVGCFGILLGKHYNSFVKLASWPTEPVIYPVFEGFAGSDPFDLEAGDFLEIPNVSGEESRFCC